eukprot:GHVN01071721.1.p1 GENE.GHVN01071721.1~~GHVN01071721.1.p1  ORF type:complete len:214 (+),score=54.05 GHVN01071721.1:211-852(+)
MPKLRILKKIDKKVKAEINALPESEQPIDDDGFTRKDYPSLGVRHREQVAHDLTKNRITSFADLEDRREKTEFITVPVDGADDRRVMDVMSRLKQLTLGEAAVLVKMIEKEFNVDASVSGGGGGGVSEGGETAEEDEEDNIPVPTAKTAWEVWLLAVEYESRLKLIKMVKDMRTELSLIQAKQLVDSLPVCVFGPTKNVKEFREGQALPHTLA